MGIKPPLWGKYTWILFHWLVENIKEEYFVEERTNLIKIIESICSNLPCPSCQSHANEYLRLRPINKIQTKTGLIKYLFTFHNAVNTRGRKKVFDEGILQQYKKVNLNMLVKNWQIVFSAGSQVRQDDFKLKKNIQVVRNNTIAYIKNNYSKFV